MSLAAGVRNPALGARAVLSFVAVFLTAGLAVAQQVTGELGSPSATTTIDGKQLPPPSPKFGGVIKESAKDSTPSWPPRVVPPKGAPNVLLIMTDDQGHGVPGHKSMAHSIPIIVTNTETFDIGLDTRTPVDFTYEVPFRFTGTIDNLTYKLGPSRIFAEDQKTVARAIAIAHD
jgi:hypothetical protein